MNANGSLTPNAVRQALGVLAESASVSVFIDEFDRLTDRRTRTLFADAIKLMSDHVMPVTIVLVGVGDTVDDLIAEHASVQRHAVQIQMPRMNDDEIGQIVVKGMSAAELSVDDGFVSEVQTLAQGLPHYAHLVSQHAAYVALEEWQEGVTVAHFGPAVARALNDVSQSIRDMYFTATVSNRETIYREVLLACALAEKDELGTFGPPDVRDRLRLILGRNIELAAFATHLKDFSGDGVRGGVLKRREIGRPRYKFVDPLLPPYVLMRGKVDGLTMSEPTTG